ncbi:MAG TPA: lipopolysaccharide biosynthesis protein [Rhizomicrobium sp.]|jgi:O-antigen/teichoic acid export membrane protein|nr:lipopolysaccharide biosynthesis protein [Rhizomicrobium sp.]
MVRASAWQISVRWATRLLGLVSTIILARLLTPTDYGVVAIAALIVGTVDIFTQTGQRLAIIRHPNPSHEHYDSAWTIQVALGLLLAIAILGTIPLATIYFHEPRAAAVIPVFSLRTAIGAFENIGTLNFRRNLEFDKQFRYTVYPSVFSFFTTLISAIVLRNYWALAVGIITEQTATTVLSYTMESFRPKFCFSKVRELWSFSIWTLARGVGIFFTAQVDKIAIGGFAGAGSMGRYEVATDLATSPFRELNDPMISVLFPVMASFKNDLEKQRQLFFTVLYWSAVICASISVGIAMVASDFTDLVLGPKWQDVKPLMPWLALAYGVLGIGNGVYPTLDIWGHPHLSAKLQWFRLVALAACIVPVAFWMHNLEAIAFTRLLVTVVLTPTLFLALARVLDLRARDFVITLWRPVVGSIVMAGAVLLVNSWCPFRGPPRLFLDSTVGALVFIGSLMVLWLLVGRPDGPERVLWNRSRKIAFRFGLSAAG